MLTVQYKEVYPYPHYDDEYAKLLQVSFQNWRID